MLSVKGDWLYFHWKAILLSAASPNRWWCTKSPTCTSRTTPAAFWRRLEHAMPDYAQRKAWLAKHGVEVEEIGVPVFTTAILNRICAISPPFDPQ